MYLLLSKESVSWGEGSTDSGLPYPTLFSYPFLPSNCTTWGNLLSFSEYLFLFKICIIWRITFITEVLQESRRIMLLKHNPWYIRERVPYDSRDSQESSPAPQFKSISSLALTFFMVQLLHLYMTTCKNHSFDYMDLCWQSDIYFVICCLYLF